MTVAESCEQTESPALPRGFLGSADGDAGNVYLRPLGPRSADRYEVLLRSAGGAIAIDNVPIAAVRSWAEEEGVGLVHRVADMVERISALRPAFAGLSLDRPVLMGIINVTPDSFSDGGDFRDSDRAIAHGRILAAAGADILDVGGESTRPGADSVSPEDEIARVVPVVCALAAEGLRVSIDTRRARVMQAALDAGATIINDVTALSGDPDSLSVAAASGVPVVLMHMLGEPGTMQRDPQYDDVVLDIFDYLAGRIAACEAAGIERTRIAVDPGIGFGKTVAHNTRILSHLGVFHGLGCAVLLGVSRKSFIARLSAEEAPKDRIAGSLAAALAGISQGVQILRVHDVAETRQALTVWGAVAEAAEQAG